MKRSGHFVDYDFILRIKCVTRMKWTFGYRFLYASLQLGARRWWSGLDSLAVAYINSWIAIVEFEEIFNFEKGMQSQVGCITSELATTSGMNAKFGKHDSSVLLVRNRVDKP